MTLIEFYLNFCKKFQKIKLPILKFKQLNPRIISIYKKEYKINENDIYRGSFIVFLITFISSLIISIIFININILIIILYSILLSLIFSYKFNLILLKDIERKESIINLVLYLIKINFSLIQNTLKENTDYCVNFIQLIKSYNLPITQEFKKAFIRLHEGETPEKFLTNFTSASEDFDNYLRDLLINDFKKNNFSFSFDKNTLEKKFKIYLREIESKLSIFFFIGLFFPIGLCFLLLFGLLSFITLIFSVPCFFLILNYLFKTFMKKRVLLTGVINQYSKFEKRKYNEFLLFLEGFANNLGRNISPEKAFIQTYSQNKHFLTILTEILRDQTIFLLTFSYSLSEVIENLKTRLNSIRFKIILEVMNKILYQNALLSSEKIYEILTLLSRHKKLEKKLEVIIKGEKFKVLFFIFLLPTIIGFIGGLFPFFLLLTKGIEWDKLTKLDLFLELICLKDFVLIFSTLLLTIILTSYYFLKIINFNNKIFLISITNLLFILTFLISIINILHFI